MNPLSSMYSALKYGSVKVVQQLLEMHPELLHAPCEGGKTLLHCACEYFAADPVRLFLNSGLDPNRTDGGNCTPLWIALTAERESPDVVKALLEGGADPNIQRDRDSPLHLAVCFKRSEVFVRDLLAHGADPNVLGTMGRSPLFLAVKRRQLETVKLLLTHGADPVLKRYPGTMTAYELAKMRQTDDIYAMVNAFTQARAIREMADGRGELSADRAPQRLPGNH